METKDTTNVKLNKDPGTQDTTLDKAFFKDPERGGRIPRDKQQYHVQCLNLVNGFSSNIKYLHHEGTTIRLRSPTGPLTTFKVFGSPYVPKRNGVDCAFGYERQIDRAELLWSHIPLDTDILLTHTPAYNHRDASTEWQTAGYEALRRALWQVRPRLAVCGRIREARGIEKVQWELGQNYPPFWERQTTQIDDPNTKANKWSALDMTSSGVDPLLNNGAPGQQLQQNHVSFSSTRGQSEATSSGAFDDNHSTPPSEVLTMLSGLSNMTTQTEVTQWKMADVNNRLEASQFQPLHPRLYDSNQAALWNRLGRQETLIVNASIQRKKRRRRGPAMLRTPIVVDIELPVGDEFA